MYDIAAFEKGIKSMSNMREERRRRFQADLDAHEVTVIPAKEEYLVDIREKDELVGAYCRVSTMSDEQVESYDLQRKEYEDKVPKTITGLWSMFMRMRVSQQPPRRNGRILTA